MRIEEIELMIKELEAILQYEEVLKNKEKNKPQISVKRLERRIEEWNKISKEYNELKEEISKKIIELRKLLMKKLDVFESYYQKYGSEA